MKINLKMFFLFFSLLYLIYFTGFIGLYVLNNDEKKRDWNIFTRLISSINAIQCILMVCNIQYNVSNEIFHLKYYPEEYSTNSLFFFSAYLFMDGTFQLPDLFLNPSIGLILSLFHHFLGGLGIYLIAESHMGFYLGFYFAMTEISTPFLNLSWYYRKKFLFYIFYLTFFLTRILTIPLLLNYLNSNHSLLLPLTSLQFNMSYYGSYFLILLNSIWYILITIKLLTF